MTRANDSLKTLLGWLTVADEMIGVAGDLMEYAEFIRQRGFRHVMVCGMGGSSLPGSTLGKRSPDANDSLNSWFSTPPILT